VIWSYNAYASSDASANRRSPMTITINNITTTVIAKSALVTIVSAV
jgi:hypothetical protein